MLDLQILTKASPFSLKASEKRKSHPNLPTTTGSMPPIPTPYKDHKEITKRGKMVK